MAKFFLPIAQCQIVKILHDKPSLLFCPAFFAGKGGRECLLHFVYNLLSFWRYLQTGNKGVFIKKNSIQYKESMLSLNMSDLDSDLKIITIYKISDTVITNTSKYSLLLTGKETFCWKFQNS